MYNDVVPGPSLGEGVYGPVLRMTLRVSFWIDDSGDDDDDDDDDDDVVVVVVVVCRCD